ncbi:BON domain-containing protein [Aliidiomarina sp. Khilg15.8]
MPRNLLLALCLLPFLSGCAAVVAGGAVGATMVAMDSREVGTQVDDSGLRLRAQSAIGDISELADQRVQVLAYNGNVLLYGQVSREQLRDAAVRAVRDVRGVGQVYNQLRVGAPVSFAQRTRDTLLTSRVKAALLTDSEYDHSNIKVVSENAEVFLIGITSRDAANAAIEDVRNLNGVERVVDVLERR